MLYGVSGTQIMDLTTDYGDDSGPNIITATNNSLWECVCYNVNNYFTRKVWDLWQVLMCLDRFYSPSG